MGDRVGGVSMHLVLAAAFGTDPRVESPWTGRMRRQTLPEVLPAPSCASAGLSRGRISAAQLSCSHWPLPSWQCRPPSPVVALGKQVVEPRRAQA